MADPILYYRRGGASSSITLYNAEDGGWHGSLPVRGPSATWYAQLDTNESHANASYMRVYFGGTLYAVLATSGAPTNYWEVHHDNSDWAISGGIGSWDAGNSEWDSGDYLGAFEAVLLSELGTWVNSYRPSKIRITFTGATNAAFTLYDESLDIIASEGGPGGPYSYQSGEEIDINYDTEDIKDLGVFTANGDFFSITNIEFYVGP